MSEELQQVSLLNLTDHMWAGHGPGYRQPPWFVFSNKIVDRHLSITSPKDRCGRQCLAVICSDLDDPPQTVILTAVEGNVFRRLLEEDPGDIGTTVEELEAQGYNFDEPCWVANPT